MFNWVMC